MNNSRFFLWAVGLWGGVLCLGFAYRPIIDPDFWWHLKTGEEMLRTGGLLSSDPFCFTSDGTELTLRQRTILQGYWLWQTGYYAGFALGGLWGVLVLNVFLLLLVYGILTWRLVKCRLNAVVGAVLILLSLGVFATYYSLERPQVYSFLCCLLLIILFDQYRDHRRLSGWLFPLMGVWGNLHGGVVVGIGLLCLFMIGAGIQLRHDRRQLVKCSVWVAGGMVGGLLNPTAVFAFPVIVQMFSGQQIMVEGVREYNSTFQLFSEGRHWLACLWVLMGVHGVGLLCSRGRWLFDYLLFFVLLLFCSLYVRNLAFFAVCLLPQTMHYLREAGLAERKWVRPAAVGGCLLLLLGLSLHLYRRADSPAGQPSLFYPVKMVSFIKDAGLGGRVYNDYDWGGFLLWNLYPETRLFIDGRGIDEKVYDHWRRIRWVSSRLVQGVPEYRLLLSGYGVEYIIQKNISKYGLTEPLMRSLLSGDEWVPVYQDELGYIIVKNIDKYKNIIERYRLKKEIFFRNLIEIYGQKIILTNDPQLYMGRGELYFYLNDLPAARQDLLQAKKVLGADDYLTQLLTKAAL